MWRKYGDAGAISISSHSVSELSFRLQPQLPASRVNIAAFLAAPSVGNFLLFKRGDKAFAGFFTRALPRQSLDFVVWNQIHLGLQATSKRGQRLGLIERVVHPSD